VSFPDLLTFDLVASMATAEATRLGRPMVISHSPGAWHIRNAGTPALPGFVDVATIMPEAGTGDFLNLGRELNLPTELTDHENRRGD
jgi:hypothetical protein